VARLVAGVAAPWMGGALRTRNWWNQHLIVGCWGGQGIESIQLTSNEVCFRLVRRMRHAAHAACNGSGHAPREPMLERASIPGPDDVAEGIQGSVDWDATSV
jgi:hypothetical protein